MLDFIGKRVIDILLFQFSHSYNIFLTGPLLRIEESLANLVNESQVFPTESLFEENFFDVELNESVPEQLNYSNFSSPLIMSTPSPQFLELDSLMKVNSFYTRSKFL